MARRPARATKLLNEMRRNPRGDWRIQQPESVARSYEVNAGKVAEATSCSNMQV
jgi:hypothetical protein